MSVDAAHSPPATSADPHPIRVAMEARDQSAMEPLLASDVVLHSPVTAYPFRGKTLVSALLRELANGYEEYSCAYDFAHGDIHVLVFRMRIRGRDAELVDLIRFDEQGLITEIRIHSRPLASTAAFAAMLGPRLARRRGRVAAVLARLLAGPLPGLLAAGDRLVTPLTQPRA